MPAFLRGDAPCHLGSPEAVAASSPSRDAPADSAIVRDPDGSPVAVDRQEFARTPASSLRSTFASIVLARRMQRAGWYPHQHREVVIRTERGSSVPVVQPLSPEARAIAVRIQAQLDDIAERPMSVLTIPESPWAMDDRGGVRLRWSSDQRPSERSYTRTDAMSDDDAETVLRTIVAEIASDWASVNEPGLSAGRIFIGPKARMIFWPRLMNELLADAPSLPGSIFDLFSVVATCGVKMDLKSAYRAVRIASEDARYHAACLNGVWVTFDRLSFGMSQSPAAFADLLNVTIRRHRSSMPALSALAQFVDDSGVSGQGPVACLRAAEALISAFRADGWWLSIAKSFLMPASRLAYTGFVADFDKRAVALDPAKLQKALDILNTVRRPPDAAIEAADPGCFAPGVTPPSWFDPTFDLPEWFFAAFPSHARRLPRAAAGSASGAGAGAGSSASVAPGPPVHATSPAAPSSPGPSGTHPPTSATLPPRQPRLTDRECHAISSVVGYLCWFQVVTPFLAPWRLQLALLARTGTWSAAGAVAFDCARELLCSAHEWTRSIDPVGPRLNVIVDASGTGWGAVLVSPDSSSPVYLAGLLPEGADSESSTFREAIGAVSAIWAALGRGHRFGHVRVATDSKCLEGSAAGRVRSQRVATALRALAAWQAQGLSIEFEWQPRGTASHKLADGLSAAARPRPWPLRPEVRSYLWDQLGGWDVDVATHEEVSSTSAYATPDADDLPPDRRAAIADVIASVVASRSSSADPVGTAPVSSPSPSVGSPPSSGWIGTTSTAPLQDGSVAFAHSLWSELRPLAARWASPGHPPPSSLIVVAPRDSADFWGPHLDAIRAAATMRVDLPPRSTTPPVPGIPVDPRPLTAYVIGPRPPRSRPRPAWWTAWRLTADGDIEANPGPDPERNREAALFRPRSAASSSAAAPSAPPSAAPQARRPLAPHCTPATTPPRRSRPPSPPRRDAATAAPPAPPACAAPAGREAALFATASAPPPVTAPATATALPPATAPCRSPPACRRRLATAVGHPASTAPAPATPTVGDWLRAILRVHGGRDPGAAPAAPDGTASGAGVAAAHLPALATARSDRARRANTGSSAPVSVAIRALRFAEYRGVVDHPWSLAELDAFVLDMAQCRVADRRPLRWSKIGVPQAMDEASRLAAASRRAGFPAPAYCGPNTLAWCETRGGRSKREHSSAWPLHVSLLLRVEPADRSSHDWKVWASLVVLSLFCLRSGISQHLHSHMFVPYDDGYILVWRFVQKRSIAADDANDPDAISRVGSVTAARHPVLTRIIGTGAASGDNTPLFGDVTPAQQTAFVKRLVPGAPAAFDIRVYGTRTAADADATELRLPPAIVDVLFWWKREGASRRMQHYYSGVNIRLMYVFSERRCSIQYHPSFPGRYDAVVASAELRQWDSVGIGTTLPAPPSWADIGRAMRAKCPSLAVARRVRAECRRVRARRAAGDSSTEDAQSGDASDTLVGVCCKCACELGPGDDGAACVVCPMLACVECHNDLSEDFRCPAHSTVKGKRPRAARV